MGTMRSVQKTSVKVSSLQQLVMTLPQQPRLIGIRQISSCQIIYHVTNQGNVTLNKVTLIDPSFDVLHNFGRLLPFEKVTLTLTLDSELIQSPQMITSANSSAITITITAMDPQQHLIKGNLVLSLI